VSAINRLAHIQTLLESERQLLLRLDAIVPPPGHQARTHGNHRIMDRVVDPIYHRQAAQQTLTETQTQTLPCSTDTAVRNGWVVHVHPVPAPVWPHPDHGTSAGAAVGPELSVRWPEP